MSKRSLFLRILLLQPEVDEADEEEEEACNEETACSEECVVEDDIEEYQFDDTEHRETETI